MKNIYVVIPNSNGADMIGECLMSIEKQSLKHEIIVVENGSTDNSAEYIKNNFKKVTLLEFKDNAGFAGGVNRGINYALKNNAKHIALFNNDATAVNDWLKNLVTEADKHPEAGIVTGKLLRSDGKHID